MRAREILSARAEDQRDGTNLKPGRDDKLYAALYEEHGIGRLEVTQRLAMLIKNGCVSTPKPGYYLRTAPAFDNGTITKQL